MPLPESFYDAIEDGDRFIVSFPRSGNRWLRVLIADIVNQAKGLDPSSLYEVQLEDEIGIDSPTSSCLDLRDVIPDCYLRPRNVFPAIQEVLKPTFRTHNFDQVFSRSKHRVIYLFRKPENVLVSHYHFLRSADDPAVRNLDLSEFAIHWIPLWIDHVTGALEGFRAEPDRVLLVEYQDKLPFTQHQLSLVTAFLELDCDRQMKRDAMRRFRSLFKSMNRKQGHPYPRGRNARVSSRYSEDASATIQYFTNDLYADLSEWARGQLAAFKRSCR